MGEIIWHPRLKSGWHHGGFDLAQLRRLAGLGDDLEEHGRRLRRESGWPIPRSMYLSWELGETQPPRAVRDAAYRLAAQPGPGTDDEMKRREFLKAGTAFVLAPVLSNIADGWPAAESRILDGLEELTRHYAEQWYTLAPHVLFQVVNSHLRVLGQLADDAAPPTDRRLKVTIGETALLAGLLSFQLGSPKTAGQHYSHALTMGEEAGHSSLVAHALAATSHLFSAVPSAYGNQDANPRVALALLNEAVRVAGRETSLMRASILARRAEELALAGDEVACHRDLVLAEAIVCRAGPGGGLFKHWTLNRLAGYRGSCDVLLGHPDRAIQTLIEASNSTGDNLVPRAVVLADLGAARALEPHADVEQVTADLSEALTLATKHGVVEHVARVAGIRARHLGKWTGLHAVADLDERLRHAQALCGLSARHH